MRSWFSKKKNFRASPEVAGSAMAELVASFQEMIIRKLGEYGNVDPVEAFALGVFGVAWSAGNHERIKSLLPEAQSRLFNEFYKSVYAVAIKDFALDEKGYESFHNRVTERFADFDGHSKLSFQPGAKNQFGFGDLIAERLFGQKKGTEAALACFVYLTEYMISCGRFFKEMDLRR